MKEIQFRASCHGTRGFDPVRHSCIPYYESKPGRSGTMSTGFALPWARQKNGSNSQPVCIRIFLDPSSALSSRLATSSPNSTGSACLNSKESRALYHHTHFPKARLPQSAQPATTIAYGHISWVSRLRSVTFSHRHNHARLDFPRTFRNWAKLALLTLCWQSLANLGQV